MKQLWKTVACVCLGLLAGRAVAQEPTAYRVPREVQAASASPNPAGGGSLFAVLREAPGTPAAKHGAAAVTLERPVPLGGTRAAPPVQPDPQVQPASFLSQGLLARGKAEESPRLLGSSSSISVQPATVPTVTATPPTGTPGASPLVGTMLPSSCWGVGDCGAVPVTDGGPAACGMAAGCCDPATKFYVSAEYLVWWLREDKVPPLVTTGSLNDPFPGALGMPGTSVLFGGAGIGSQPSSGLRITGGYWLGCGDCLGVEASGFFLGDRSSNFTASSLGTPTLFRPFFNAALGVEDAELVAVPGVVAGSVAVAQSSQLWGAEANLRTPWWKGCWYRLDLLAGFRYIGLDDDLTITENLTVIPIPATILLQDSFNTRNRFYGGQLGFDSEVRLRRWAIGWKAKIALGDTNQVAYVNGGQIITDANGTRFANGGLLTQPSNIGRFSRDMFSIVGETGVTVSYQITDSLRAYVGYNLLYWNNTMRAGSQIDRAINCPLLPSACNVAGRPAFPFRGTDFWAQGVNCGLEFRY